MEPISMNCVEENETGREQDGYRLKEQSRMVKYRGRRAGVTHRRKRAGWFHTEGREQDGYSVKGKSRLVT
jgi:hypothetical protein